MTRKKIPVTQVAPQTTHSGFPVVGIGASAGGLAAFEAFFSGMPRNTNPGMAFVLVQHLAPDHKSLLTEIIQRYTPMPVFQVEDGMIVQPNCIYIIPPNYDMAFQNGALHLLDISKTDNQRLPIDFFFRSLAQDQHERAIGIILSGAGSDGSQGIRLIKSECGMVMAQSPESIEFDSMPSSAIATGLVDYVLPAAAMPAKLIDYVTHAFGKLSQLGASLTLRNQASMKKIFILLRKQTGHDFSQYKPNTINRRIERRMAVHQIGAIDDYIKYLQQTPIEVEALFLDMLIGVTNFFRDPAAFQALAEQINAKLFINKSLGTVIRAWVPGCSTGEEAYSIAILLVEAMEAQKLSYTVQIFATDINHRAIVAARAGLYPASISDDISPERLARFFTAEPDGSGYCIHKRIREMMVFSEHDLIKDPSFSKLDLISCRNLMIYLDAFLQKKIIPLFHYSLNQGGLLFLGTSESVGEYDDLFSVLDRKSKLYLRKENIYGRPHGSQRLFIPPMTAINAAVRQNITQNAFPAKPPLRELTEQMLLQHLAPSAALVNSKGDIFYLHGRTGMYLEPAEGEVGINNILKMSRTGLRPRLTITLHKAATTGEVIHDNALRVKTNGHFTLVNLSIRPVTSTLTGTLESPLYLVIFEETPGINPEQMQLALADNNASRTPDDNLHLIVELRRELQAKEDYLLSTHVALESSNEELKSANEEMQSVNEELQSTNEELETSKEELQSVNEELSTVNNELQAKVDIAAQLSSDMNNLLDGSGIATLFVDNNLRILRFNPLVTQIINLLQRDTNRPVNHIASNLVNYDRLGEDINSVLKTLIPIESRVQASDDKWYTMRIQPYRTLDNTIEGAVITFVDITGTKRIEDELEKANRLLRLAVVVRDAYDAITVQDLNGRIIAWNPGAVRMYGWSEDEALLMNVSDRIPDALRKKELAKIVNLGKGKIMKPYRTQRLTEKETVVEVWIMATALVNETGQMYAVATTERVNEAQTHQRLPT
ncbi:MAG: chemotaxis protein CheB [Methylobacter sp.]|nr:chemotaxis protein CheB [Methylobacter sp.]